MFPLTQNTLDRLLTQGPYAEPGRPFYPFTVPGMPMPGPSFIKHAQELGDATQIVGKGRSAELQIGHILPVLYFQALYDPFFSMPIIVGNRTVSSRFVQGHLWDERAEPGPRPSPVMVIGKWPGREEEQQRRLFVGPTSEHFWTACDNLGIPMDYRNDWYFTNLLRFVCPDLNVSKVPTGWINDCLPLLFQELRIVRPQYILCVGTDASKVVTRLCPITAGQKDGLGVETMRGRVEPLHYPLHTKADQKPEWGVAQVMTVVHPAQVHRTPELMDTMQDGISGFWQLSCGKQIGGMETDVDHRVIRDEHTLAGLVDEILASNNPAHSILAVDAEWNGQKQWDPEAYLRTVQFSHKPKFGACVVLREAGGAPAFSPNLEAAIYHLRRLFLHPKMQIGGHFFRSDIPWIKHFLGIDLGPKYAPADSPEKVTTEGGWDTSLLENAVNETGFLGLEVLRSKYTTAPPYEIALTKWLKKFCAARGIEPDEIEGFGDWDDPSFYTYACYDADVTRRAVDRLFQLVQHDRFGHDARKSYWLTHRASRAVMEMEQVGILPDPQRAEELAATFAAARGVLVENIRRMVNWETFNPNSDQQCRAVLFGDRFGRKQAPAGCPTIRLLPGEQPAVGVKRALNAILSGEAVAPMPGSLCWIYLMPEGVQPQDLPPITSTGKRPQAWEKIMARGEEDQHSPSTGREVLGILGHHNPVAAVLRDIRFLTKALQTVLRRPEIDPDTGTYMKDDDGQFVYSKGLLSYTSSDSRIHTRMLQTMETGRSSSSKPPLQNISKRREDDYKRILGYRDKDGALAGSYCGKKARERGQEWLQDALYKTAQRTIFRARPGHVFIEADYAGAELAGIMWMASDPQGIEDVRRNMLPENHADYFDIHSNSAVMAFGLTCAPTKKALKENGTPGLRVAAKNVNFGIPYGRGAEAIARQCREEGVDASEADAQKLIDYYFHRYNCVQKFLDDCKQRTKWPMWMRGAFGRYRRFHHTDDRQVSGEQERQACNFPIQNLVADAVWTALANMWDYRETYDVDFEFVLQIHDAILLQVPYASVPRVYRDVFPTCMVDGVDVIPCDLDGNPFPLPKPYHMSSDREIMFRWGEDADDVIARVQPDFGELKKLLVDPANDARVIAALQAAELAV